MKRLLSTLAEKWPEYMIESVVIVASILGAYALDNWNQDRIDFKRSIDYHHRIVENLDYLIQLNEGRLERSKTVLESIVKAIDILESGELNAEDTATFRLAMNNYGRFGSDDQQLYVFDEMKSNGDLGLIYDSELRKEMARFNSKFIAYENILKVMDKVLSENQSYFDKFGRVRLESGHSVFHYDFPRMSASDDFINVFSRSINSWNVRARFSESHRNEMKKLKEKVEAELARLESKIE